MTDRNQTPEQIARDKIDALLEKAGWIIQSAKKLDFNSGLGIAVREYQTDILLIARVGQATDLHPNTQSRARISEAAC